MEQDNIPLGYHWQFRAYYTYNNYKYYRYNRLLSRFFRWKISSQLRDTQAVLLIGSCHGSCPFDLTDLFPKQIGGAKGV
jgi:hypothetical protein